MSDHRFAAGQVGEQEFTLVLDYDDLKAVARDWRHFSSDTPFRVPIPEERAVRPVRQYPIETDPPEHGRYRALIEDRFSRTRAVEHRPLIEAVVEQAVLSASGGTIDVVPDLAIPVVATGIAATLGRPSDAERLASWGLHVFRDREGGPLRRNPDLDAYLTERVDAALDQPGDDLFGDLARAEIGGRRLSRDELLGYGYLVLAGGRDTVIGSIVGALWHLGTHPDIRDWLRGRADRIAVAVEEYVRYFAPIPFIGRTVAAATELSGTMFEPGSLVALSFASANHDPSAFEQPSACIVDRRPNRHLAFGHGPHTCIGAPLARMEIATVIEVLLRVASDVTALDPGEWHAHPTRPTMSTGLPPRLVVAVTT